MALTEYFPDVLGSSHTSHYARTRCQGLILTLMISDSFFSFLDKYLFEKEMLSEFFFLGMCWDCLLSTKNWWLRLITHISLYVSTSHWRALSGWARAVCWRYAEYFSVLSLLELTVLRPQLGWCSRRVQSAMMDCSPALALCNQRSRMLLQR